MGLILYWLDTWTIVGGRIMDDWVGGLILIFILIFINVISWREKNRHKVGMVKGIVYILTGLLLWKNGWNINPVLIVIIPGITITLWDLVWYLREKGGDIGKSQDFS